MRGVGCGFGRSLRDASVVASRSGWSDLRAAGRRSQGTRRSRRRAHDGIGDLVDRRLAGCEARVRSTARPTAGRRPAGFPRDDGSARRCWRTGSRSRAAGAPRRADRPALSSHRSAPRAWVPPGRRARPAGGRAPPAHPAFAGGPDSRARCPRWVPPRAACSVCGAAGPSGLPGQEDDAQHAHRQARPSATSARPWAARRAEQGGDRRRAPCRGFRPGRP